MNLEQAKKLKPGDTIRYPEDRAVPAGVGKVVSVGTEVQTHLDQEFYWVDVQHAGHRSIWPSNRLG